MRIREDDKIPFAICGLALVAVFLMFWWDSLFAHDTYMGKSYEFRGEGHLIEVRLEQTNTVTVFLDNISLGTRNDFCKPLSDS